jgi:hypothetical protein
MGRFHPAKDPFQRLRGLLVPSGEVPQVVGILTDTSHKDPLVEKPRHFSQHQSILSGLVIDMENQEHDAHAKHEFSAEESDSRRASGDRAVHSEVAIKGG